MDALILPMSILSYLMLPAWLWPRGRPMIAGGAMIASALLPWTYWYLTAPRPWGPGAGAALVVTAGMLLLALVPVIDGAMGLRLQRSVRSNGES